MIVMCIRLILSAAISFRAVPKAIRATFSSFIAVQKQRIPSYKTVTRWLTIVGLYKLTRPKKKAKDWALIVDNSVQIGTQKCLVVLGIRLSEFKGQPLTFEDMEPLIIELHDNGSAETVCKALEKARIKVGDVEMVCSDDGPDLRGGINAFCKKNKVGRVFDIVHKIATFLKKNLQDQLDWELFASAAAEAKRKMQQTKAAHLAPPNQRTKSRFLNIEVLTGWAVDIIVAMEQPGHPDKEALKTHCGWVLQYKALIQRLKQYVLISRSVRQYVREKGFHKKMADEIEKNLDLLELDLDGMQYAGVLHDFIIEQSQLVPENKAWVGSSEIIESLYGKVKHLEQDQSKGGFTSLILGAAACVGEVSTEVVAEAMRRIKTKDVDAWVKEQIGETLVSKRRKSLGLWRKRKIKLKVEPDLAGIIEREAVCF